ncbi:helix-turn-helix transcriptional regulator [Loktanella sp. M215]|uniref:helix-turn-helix transcriptional regulator n=1 Tax=Loktanella sp. M215 TaxID=2675431 RepID=UPI001F19AA35|nr:helix-turn-helix transcriptional regulator [Loktanella sp. M215]MCF7702410.1 helix-turn-helix domain-containing protein [Loktanella sp. M215]
MAQEEDNGLGRYLKDRRGKLDPAAFGFPLTRRRTPGLRREEVALRANVSATWYTWLEQGRGGAPSVDVLDRISRALVLTPAEREHLFLIAQDRPPKAKYTVPEAISDQLQRVLDSLVSSPAVIRSAIWDVVAWNRAATLILSDYSAMEPGERNILRIFFTDPRIPNGMLDWEQEARFMVAAFRADVARAGASQATTELVAQLSAASPAFAAMWQDNEVASYGEGHKNIVTGVLGPMTLEYASFTVDGRPDLGLMIYTPASRDVASRIAQLVAASTY